MSIVYFPKIYPDELVSSVLARYRVDISLIKMQTKIYL